VGVNEGLARALFCVFLWASVTHLLATGSIFESIKRFVIRAIPRRCYRLEKLAAELLYCSQCLGFWVGLAGSLFSFQDIPLPVGVSNAAFAAAVSSIALILTRMTEKPEDED